MQASGGMLLKPSTLLGSQQEAVMFVIGLNGEVVADEAMLAAAEEQPSEPPAQASTPSEE